MARIPVVLLLLLATCSFVWAAAGAQPTDFASLLSGSSVPLVLKMKGLDGSWRRFTATGVQEAGGLYASMYGVASVVYYSKGQIVSAAGEIYLLAYSLQAKRPSYANMLMARGVMPEPETLTADSPVALSLLNIRTMGSLTDIRPFDRDAEIEAYMKSYTDIRSAMASEVGEPSGAMGNLKNIALAVQLFMADYDKAPPAKSPEEFRKALEEYVKNEDVFKDPETGTYYTINPSVSDMSTADVEDPGKTVIAYQAEPGKDGKRGAAFLDGHVQRVGEDEWKTLKAGSNIP